MAEQTLLRTIEEIGFDEKEAAVYVALLELGQGTAGEIAVKAKLKRPIVYHVIDRLKNKGFAHDVVQKGVKKFASADPSKLFQNIKAATDNFKFMLPVMRALQNKGSEKPRIEFFEGKDAALSVFRTYEHSKSMRYITSMERIYDLIPEEADAWAQRTEKEIIHSNCKHMLVDSKVDKDWGKCVISGGHGVRLLPKGIEMEMDFAIVDDMLGITSFAPFFVVVIYSEGIARSAAQLFDLAWEQCRNLK